MQFDFRKKVMDNVALQKIMINKTTAFRVTVDAVLSQSLIGLRAAMSLALPARRCYQSCKSTDTLHKD